MYLQSLEIFMMPPGENGPKVALAIIRREGIAALI
jgi:hypothetical protein